MEIATEQAALHLWAAFWLSGEDIVLGHPESCLLPEKIGAVNAPAMLKSEAVRYSHVNPTAPSTRPSSQLPSPIPRSKVTTQPMPPLTQAWQVFHSLLYTFSLHMGGRAFGPPLCRGSAPATPPPKTISHPPYAVIPAVRLIQCGGCQQIHDERA